MTKLTTATWLTNAGVQHSDKAPRDADVYVQAAAFYVACLKAGFLEEATEFAEWYLDTFDTDLED